MSRCLPYPPPGYTLRRAGEAALIESIKPQKRKEKSQRKTDKKKDRKERSKEKKNKSEALRKSLEDKTRPETDPLERSSLSEEHGLPVVLGVPSSSTESIENSNKRKRNPSPDDSPPFPGSKIIRIRLPSKKQNETVSSSVNESQPCSTSERATTTTSPSTSQSKHGLEDLRYNFEAAASCTTVAGTSKISDASETAAAAPQRQDSATRRKQRAYLRYNDVILNWIPPSSKDEAPPADSGDIDWLFPRGRSQKSTCETTACGNSISTAVAAAATATWPRAHYVPEIGIYAMPFTVPL